MLVNGGFYVYFNATCRGLDDDTLVKLLLLLMMMVLMMMVITYVCIDAC